MKRSILLTTLSLCLSIHAQVTPPAAPNTEPAKEEPKAEEPNIAPVEKPKEGEPNAIPQKVIPKALIVEDEPFIPVGGIGHLTEQADKDLFTKGKDVGHVRNDPKQKHRRLVQRTIMPTEPLSPAGAVLTFDDYLISDSPSMGSASDIVKALSPLNTRAIFFANVNGVSGNDVSRIMRKRVSNSQKKKLVQQLLDSKKKEFVNTIRSLIKAQGPADADGNREYTCEVFNHTAFHQDMSGLKLGTTRFEICIMGIEFIEQCLDEAYKAERPGWQRARYFRFPFLHVPKDMRTKAALNKTFTKLGLISVGETQDSKDFVNFSAKVAYRSLAAAKKHKCYNPKYGIYGSAEQPVALFHTKTWNKIKSGVIKAIKEN